MIAPGLLLPYLAEADVERIVYDPPNRRLNASRRTRFTGAVRRLIEVRDVHCQHPAGCDEPATRCDVDHVVPRSRGGVTCLCNGQLLCTFHNRIVKAAAKPVGATVHPCLHPGHHPHDRIATNNNRGRAPPAAG